MFYLICPFGILYKKLKSHSHLLCIPPPRQQHFLSNHNITRTLINLCLFLSQDVEARMSVRKIAWVCLLLLLFIKSIPHISANIENSFFLLSSTYSYLVFSIRNCGMLDYFSLVSIICICIKLWSFLKLHKKSFYVTWCMGLPLSVSGTLHSTLNSKNTNWSAVFMYVVYTRCPWLLHKGQ